MWKSEQKWDRAFPYLSAMASVYEAAGGHR